LNPQPVNEAGNCLPNFGRFTCQRSPIIEDLLKLLQDISGPDAA
jgi:hypothetical protein